MKSTLVVLALIALFFSSCSSRNTKYDKDGRVLLQPIPGTSDTMNVQLANPVDTTDIFLPDSSFNGVASCVEANGDIVPERGVPCDHRMEIDGLQGNIYVLMTVRRNEKKEPSTKAPVSQVNVYVYKNGKKDKDHFLFYFIRKGCIIPGDPNRVDEIKLTHQGILGMFPRKC